MDISNLTGIFSGQNIFFAFFKTFSVLFSFLYIVYALVIYKQTQVMILTVVSKTNNLILKISLIQIAIGIVLFFFALVLL